MTAGEASTRRNLSTSIAMICPTFAFQRIRTKPTIFRDRTQTSPFLRSICSAGRSRVGKVGELDRDGHFTAHFELGKSDDDLKDDDYRQFRDVDLAAYVTDLTTDRTEQRRFELRVTKNPIHVYISPNPSHSQKVPATFF